MKARLFIMWMLLLVSLSVFVAAQEVKAVKGDDARIPVDSVISKVVVYPQQALVTRSTDPFLAEGEHVLVFKTLPKGILKNSIQVSGQGAFILQEVAYKEHFQASLPDEKKNQINAHIEQLEESKRELEDKDRLIGNERGFIENTARKINEALEKKDSPLQLNVDNWMKMDQFYRQKLEQLDKEKREVFKQTTQTNRELDKLRRELQDLGGQQGKWQPQVDVRLKVKKAGKIHLELGYMVTGPSWQPGYDLQVSSQTRVMTIMYQAVIKQNTTEDWRNVQVILSTARPSSASQHPELNPWRLGFVKPVFRDEERKREALSYATTNVMPAEAPQMFKSEEAVVVAGSAPLVEPEPMEIAAAGVQTAATSVLFDIPARANILSDNQEHKVTIMIRDFPVHFRYSVIPKLDATAYLKAKVTNDSKYVLLAGPTNVFVDNHYVASGWMRQAADGEEFWTFLGPDDGIKVEYKIIKTLEGDKGVFSKKNTREFESQTIITNNRKTQEEIVVWDQIPMATHEDIKIKLLEPEYKKDSDNLKMDELKRLEWFFKLNPGVKVEIPFKFSIEFPADKQITNQ